jgi:hypothetical protein
MGRTEHFTPVRLKAAEAVGDVLNVHIVGHDGRQLMAGKCAIVAL